MSDEHPAIAASIHEEQYPHGLPRGERMIDPIGRIRMTTGNLLDHDLGLAFLSVPSVGVAKSLTASKV